MSNAIRLELPRDREFQAGVWYSTHESARSPAHYHDELELVLVLWGRAEYRFGARDVGFGRGSLVWIAPGQEHVLARASDDLAMWVASFRTPMVRAAEEASGLRILERAQGYGACVLADAAIEELSTSYAGIAPCRHPCSVNTLAPLLLARAFRCFRVYADGREFAGAFVREQCESLDESVRRARDLLNDVNHDVSFDVLARRCGLGRARLSRIFKRQMGLSLMKFKKQARVQAFITRFGRGDQGNMLEVALDSGFGSYSQFHRVFHEITGYAPSEHLKRVRAGIVIVPARRGLDARHLASNVKSPSASAAPVLQCSALPSRR